MPASKKSEAQKRISQLSIKIDAELYDKYKNKLREDGITITESIENHMRSYLGEVIVESNVIDVQKLLKDVENLKREVATINDLKEAMGELKPGWQKRMHDLKAS